MNLLSKAYEEFKVFQSKYPIWYRLIRNFIFSYIYAIFVHFMPPFTTSLNAWSFTTYLWMFGILAFCWVDLFVTFVDTHG